MPYIHDGRLSWESKRINIDPAQILRARLSLSPTSIITDRPRAELWFSITCVGVGCTLYVIYAAPCPGVGWWYGYINGVGGVADRMCPVLYCFHPAVQMPVIMAVHEKT